MPLLLNANAVIVCSHGGMFKIVPSTAPNVIVGGAPVLTVADVAAGSMPSGTPCPFATAAGPAPCIKLSAATGGFTTKLKIKGQPVLSQTTVFMTIAAGAGVPVPAQVLSPGNVKVQGT